jgi:multidrug efflux system membrane fusion protein
MKKSIFIAIAIAVIATLWVLSGVIGDKDVSGADGNQQSEQSLNDTSSNTPEVRVQNLTAQMMNDTLEVTGRTQASRQVMLGAETEGQIVTLLVQKGDIVAKGDILAKIGLQDRSARVSEAQQLLNQRQIQYDAAKELTEKGFNSRVRMAEAKAQLESARAQLKMARVELSNINIKAPFDGVINDQMIEVGDYVSKGTQVFEIVDLDPIEIVGFLTEKQIENITEGAEVTAKLLKGKTVTGKITFIAAAADDDTRTFRTEITLDNPDHMIKEGLTAKLQIPLSEAKAYKISPSILTLSDDGTVGVKTVSNENIVRFVPIRLLKDTPEYLWIAGLPDQVQIITVGQEFVVPGQTVKPVVSEGDGLL